MYKTYLAHIAFWLSAAFFLVTGVEISKHIEEKMFPVTTEWKIVEVVKEGNNLIIKGTFKKARDCSYIPPARAMDSTGRFLKLTSYSVTSTQNYPEINKSLTFGPWVVENGADKTLFFYHEHRCHPLYTTFSYLGQYTP